jgi:hypothetical protein
VQFSHLLLIGADFLAGPGAVEEEDTTTSEEEDDTTTASAALLFKL